MTTSGRSASVGSGGSTMIAGNTTPSDALANPTDAIDSASYLLLWDSGANNWVRWYGTTALGGRVNETQAPQYEDDTNGVALTQWKPLAVATYTPNLFTQLGTDPDVSIKATPGNVFAAACHNLNGNARFLQLHNKASAPVLNDVPRLTWLVPAGAMLIVGQDFFTASGIAFSTGIAYGFSTTEATYTAGAAADQFASVLYL